MEDFSQKIKSIQVQRAVTIPQPRIFLENRVYTDVLRDLNKKIDDLYLRLNEMEKKIEIVSMSSIKSSIENNQNVKTLPELNFHKEIENLHSTINELNKKIDERIPEKILSESKFEKETQEGDDIVEKILSEVKNLLPKKAMNQNVNDSLTIVEGNRIENIKSLLERHEKLSSVELSELVGLSRTRCNEYFKLMEKLNIVEPFIVGKEKFYKLKN
jgi:tetrahydromethanopterin S-methyltransferase subunit G